MIINDPVKEAYQRPLIMGILNVTPDSFSDGGRFISPEKALAHARQMIADGADIIDIGGESTRPGSKPVSTTEQVERIVPVIKMLYSETKCCISVDTTKSEVAHKAIEAGASIINDISAFEDDIDMAAVAASVGCPVVLMHKKGRPVDMQNNPCYNNAVEEVYRYLEERIEYADSQGVKKSKIIVDPGIGFGKTAEHNLSLIKNIERFQSLGVPVLLGASRKSFIGKILNIEEPVDRIFADASVISFACLEGTHIFRVHDVLSCNHILKMTSAILNAD